MRGAHLEPRALADLASFVEGGVEIARRVARRRRRSRARPRSPRRSRTRRRSRSRSAGRSCPRASSATTPRPGSPSCDARSLRLRAQLTSVMEGYLRSPESERLLQDRIVTTRNDRYVLLVKSEQRGQLPGILHGSSGSGASLFVEPLPAVELNNDIVELQDAERREVVRILQELTAQVGARAAAIEAMAAVLGELDAVQAMALLAVAMDAHAPQIVEGARAELELVDSRHPLLMPELAARLGIKRSSEPVPVSLRRRRRAPGARDLRPQHRRQDGRAQERGALRSHGAVRAPRPGGARQPAAGVPARLRRHRRRAVDRGEPVHLLRAPRGDRRDDQRPGAAGARAARRGRRGHRPDRGRCARRRDRRPLPACRRDGRRHHAPRSDEGVRAVDARRRGRVLRLRPGELSADVPAPASARPAAASRSRWPSGWASRPRWSRTPARGATPRSEQAEALLAQLETERAAQQQRARAARRAEGARRRRRWRAQRASSARSRRRSGARWSSSPRSCGGAANEAEQKADQAIRDAVAKRRSGAEGGGRRAAAQERRRCRDPRRARGRAEGPRARPARGAGGPLAPARGRDARARQADGPDRRGAGAPGRQGRARGLRQAPEDRHERAGRRAPGGGARPQSREAGDALAPRRSPIVALRVAGPFPTRRKPSPPSST